MIIYPSMDDFNGRITGHPKSGKKTWFPAKIFPTDPGDLALRGIVQVAALNDQLNFGRSELEQLKMVKCEDDLSTVHSNCKPLNSYKCSTAKQFFCCQEL